MTTEALNIRIDSELKQKLDNESERTGLTKTKILEGILKDYFDESSETAISSKINVDDSDTENLEARLERIEDSLNDLWEQHSQQQQQIQELKDGFEGLSCEIQHDRLQKPKSRKDIAEEAYNQSATGEDAVIWEIKPETKDDLWSKILTSSEIAEKFDVGERTIRKKSQNMKKGDQWHYKNHTFEVVEVTQNKQKRHKIISKNSENLKC